MKSFIRPISYGYALTYFLLKDWLRPRLESQGKHGTWWFALSVYLLVPWLVVIWKAVREPTTAELIRSQLVGLAMFTVAFVLLEPAVQDSFPAVWIPRVLFMAIMIGFFGLLYYSKRFLVNSSGKS